MPAHLEGDGVEVAGCELEGGEGRGREGAALECAGVNRVAARPHVGAMHRQRLQQPSPSIFFPLLLCLPDLCLPHPFCS